MNANTMYGWFVEEPDGRDGLIATVLPELPQLGTVVLVATNTLWRNETVRKRFRELALLHHEQECKPVYLRRFTFAEELERIEGGTHGKS